MTHPTPRLPARLCSCAIYSLSLTGEVTTSGWGMQVDRARLLAAIDAVAEPVPEAGRRRRAPTLTLVVCERGVSVRSRAGARDIAGLGIWASPLVVRAARFRSMVESLPGPDTHLEYSSGRLMVDWKAMKAREL